MLGNVGPAFAGEHLPDRGFAYAIPFTEFARTHYIRYVLGTNGSHYFRGQLRQVMVCSHYPSSLRSTIRKVLRLRTKKQVRGLTAGRIVAVMAHIQPTRDGSICEFPRQSMRQDVSLAGWVVDRAVTSVNPRTRPFEALPFSDQKRCQTLRHGHRARKAVTYWNVRTRVPMFLQSLPVWIAESVGLMPTVATWDRTSLHTVKISYGKVA